jgi:RNA polymerase sigma-70 factor (ECF subfamily)
MDRTETRDEWLMLHVSRGRRDELEQLVRRYAVPLLTFVQRMLGDRHRSEELFQEVFLAVWKKRHQYQYPRPFRPWLYAIALNKCRAAFRGPGVRTVGLDPFDDTAPADTGPSPSDSAIATETAALVTRAVARLPAQQRAVVVLRVWQGLSYSEVADTLRRTEATVRSHMHHALIALRKELEPHLG